MFNIICFLLSIAALCTAVILSKKASVSNVMKRVALPIFIVLFLCSGILSLHLVLTENRHVVLSNQPISMYNDVNRVLTISGRDTNMQVFYKSRGEYIFSVFLNDSNDEELEIKLMKTMYFDKGSVRFYICESSNDCYIIVNSFAQITISDDRNSSFFVVDEAEEVPGAELLSYYAFIGNYEGDYLLTVCCGNEEEKIQTLLSTDIAPRVKE